MTCVGCRYFDAEDDEFGFCRFPERAFPDWFVSSLRAEHVETSCWKHARDGEGCPVLSPALTGDE